MEEGGNIPFIGLVYLKMKFRKQNPEFTLKRKERKDLLTYI